MSSSFLVFLVPAAAEAEVEAAVFVEAVVADRLVLANSRMSRIGIVATVDFLAVVAAVGVGSVVGGDISAAAAATSCTSSSSSASSEISIVVVDVVLRFLRRCLRPAAVVDVVVVVTAATAAAASSPGSFLSSPLLPAALRSGRRRAVLFRNDIAGSPLPTRRGSEASRPRPARLPIETTTTTPLDDAEKACDVYTIMEKSDMTIHSVDDDMKLLLLLLRSFVIIVIILVAEFVPPRRSKIPAGLVDTVHD
jgi:hypothetical protein